MAEFKFECPLCGHTVETDEDNRGLVAECPYCGKGIVIPRDSHKSNVSVVYQVPLSKGRNSVPRNVNASFARTSMTLDKGLVGNAVKTDVDSSQERKEALNILRKRVLTLGTIAIIIIAFMFSFFVGTAANWGVASGGKMVAQSDTQEEDLDPTGESFDSKDLSYRMIAVDEWKCEIERGYVNNDEDDFGLGFRTSLPYDLVAAVLPFSENSGNAPSLGAAYKCFGYDRVGFGYDGVGAFWFRVKVVYSHQGVLVELLSRDTKGPGWKHCAWAFVKTSRHYKVDDTLSDGFYIFSGTARCRIGMENSTRSRQVEVKAFREMNEDITRKRGLHNK